MMLNGIGTFNQGLGNLIRHSHLFANISINLIDGRSYEEIKRPFVNFGANFAASMRLTEDPLNKLDNDQFPNPPATASSQRDSARENAGAHHRQARSGASRLSDARLRRTRSRRPSSSALRFQSGHAMNKPRSPHADGRFPVMIKLYWSPRSRSFTTLWLMEESGLPYERVLTDISTGAQKAPDFLKVNPMGKVPALVRRRCRTRRGRRDLRLHRRPVSRDQARTRH